MEFSSSLSRYIASCGIVARRKAAACIKAGEITVNGKKIIKPGYQVQPTDVVRYKGKLIKPEQKVYLALNKPKGVITTHSDQRGRPTVYDLVKGATKKRVHAIGRLDINTTGLILLTNNGDLTQRLAHPKYEIKKTYIATLDKSIPLAHIAKIKSGIYLSDGKVIIDQVTRLRTKKNNVVRVVLHSGRYRVIRRLFKALGYNVRKLDRVGYAGLSTRGLARGAWRRLTNAEIKRLKTVAAME